MASSDSRIIPKVLRECYVELKKGLDEEVTDKLYGTGWITEVELGKIQAKGSKFEKNELLINTHHAK